MTAIHDRNPWITLGRVLDTPILLRSGASLVLAALVAGAAAIAPLFLAKLVDGLAEGGAGIGVAGLASAYLFALGFGRLTGHIQSHHYTMSDQALQRRVSQLTFDRLLHLPMSFHLAANPGAVIQLHAHALQGVRMMLALACTSLLPILVQMVVVLAVVGSVFSPTIWTLVGLTIIAYVCVFAWGVHRTAGPIMLALQKQLAFSGHLSEGLANVETIKNCTAEQRFTRTYSKAAQEVETAWRACSSRRLETGLATVVVFIASVGCSTWLGLDGVRSGQMSAGDFLLLITYMLQIVGPLEMSGYAVRDLAQGAGYLSGLKDLLTRAPEGTAGDALPAVVARPRGRPPGIMFDQVSLGYGGGRRVLSNVSFSVPPGAVVAVVGATGEGKTSLLRVLQKHLSPEAGRVLIDGIPLAELEPRAMRGRIAVVSQDVALFNASLRYNLIVGKPDASDDDIWRALRLARLDAFVAGLGDGLETIVGDRGFKLSGGERQRVAIARALLRESDILLLDEATSALDAKTEKGLSADLAVMAEGRTTLIVTHRLALAAAAGSIVVLMNGQVVEQGSHRQLLEVDGTYARLWAGQMDDHAKTCAAVSGEG